MIIYNAFGIKPTNTFTSAGSDYYIPNLKDETQIKLAYKAFEKSYKKTQEEIEYLENCFEIYCKDQFPKYVSQIPNLIHLYLALYNEGLEDAKKISTMYGIMTFLNEFVVYDENRQVVGIKLFVNDTLFINSGIKVALDTVLSEKVAPNPHHAVNLFRMLGIGVAGLYVNKSGNGNKGWDVRACLVDEDYAGFVHLSMSFTKTDYNNNNIIYCGDKLIQMMLIPVFHDEYIEADEEEYNKIMENSKRGDSGFGSSDIKH